MSKRSLGARRLVGRLLGRREHVAAPELSEAERSFRHIWRYLIATGSAVRPRDRNRPNMLVLQMGKVASLAIQQALNEGGVNAFHTHSLSQASQERLFGHLLTSEFTFRLSSMTCDITSRMSRSTCWCAGIKRTGGTANKD